MACSIEDPALGDPAHVTLEWEMGDTDTDTPLLRVYNSEAADTWIELEIKLRFDGEGDTWWMGPWAVDALEVFDVAVAVPASSYTETDQDARLSSLVVSVNSWSGDGQWSAVGAEVLGVSFPWGGSLPVYLDAARQDEWAPGGVYLDAPRADEVGSYTGFATEEE
jgi:hypothetical protein